MKKTLLILAAVLVLLCAGCGKKQPAEEPDTLNREELVTASTQELTYKNESYTLRFSKSNEGAWQWKDDLTLPLDQTMMQQLLDQVSALNVLVPVEAAEDITTYDLDAPDRTLEIKNSDGSGLSLQIGAAADGGYYMTRDGDTAKIYIAPDSLVQLMDRNIYELVQLPTLPTLTADRLLRVEAQSGETAVTAVRGENQDWLCDGTDVTEQLAGLTAALAEGLRLESCVDYSPSSGALPICGLEEPAVTVSVNYRGDTGSPAAFTLKIGSAYGDGFYAMYNDVPAIFKVSAAMAELLRSLLTLAG